MSYGLSLVFTFSILIAAVIGGIRFKEIDPAYRPFLILIWVSLINEALSVALAYTIRNNTVNNNVFFLIEAILITWQFKRWKLFNDDNFTYALLNGILVVAWITEMSLFGIKTFYSYFIILHSFVIVLLSISMINRLITRENRFLLRQPIFLICTAFIGYFTFAALTETFWQYGLNENKDFRLRIYHILHYINLFSNLIYALAVLWMPTRPKFILPFSSPAL